MKAPSSKFDCEKDKQSFQLEPGFLLSLCQYIMAAAAKAAEEGADELEGVVVTTNAAVGAVQA